METIKPLSEVDPSDLAVVERVFGRRIEPTQGSVLILKTIDSPAAKADNGAVPAWCDVLEGLSDADLSEFKAMLESPVQLGNTAINHGS